MKNRFFKEKEFCENLFKIVIESNGEKFEGEGHYNISCVSDKPIHITKGDNGLYNYKISGKTYDYKSLLKEFIGTSNLYKAISFFSTEHYRGVGHIISYFKAPIKNIYQTRNYELFDVIRSIRDDEENKPIIQEIRSGLTELKYKNLDYYTFSGVFRTRRKEDLEFYSGLICLDIDKIDNPENLKKKIIELSIPLIAIFTSPSGNGLKVLLRSSLEIDKHLDYFHYFEKLFKNELGVRIDPSCKDIARACFTSYDPNLYFIHPDFITGIELHNSKTDMVLEFADKYIQKSKDGEKYTRLTKISYLLGGYHASGVIGKYDTISSLKKSIKKRGNLDDIELAFKTIEDCFEKGMDEPVNKEDIIKYLTKNNHDFESIANDVKPKQNSEYKLNDVFYSDSLFKKLPNNIQRLVNKVKNDHNQSFQLYTFLILSSGIFPKIAFSYGANRYSLNISSLTLAESASGKSASNLVRELFMGIDNHLRKQTVEKKPKSLILSTNISGSELIHRLALNDGSLILYDTEITAYLDVNNKEWGDIDTLFRQGASNDPIGQYRRDSKDVYIEFPMISISLTGTPSQITSLFKDKLNGLYSRFMYYTFSGVDTWINKLAFKMKEDLTKEKEYLLNIYNHYKENEIKLSIDIEAQEIIDKKFSELYKKYTSDPIIKSVIARYAIYAWKLSIIIKLYDCYEKETTDILIDAQVMELVLEIVLESLSVATDLSFNLNQESLTNEQRLVKILSQIGGQFSRGEALELIKGIVSPRTFDRILKESKKYKKIGHGKYLIL
ncbi:MAG: BT4734/BF3469 family protein [Chlorobiota bacterium]